MGQQQSEAPVLTHESRTAFEIFVHIFGFYAPFMRQVRSLLIDDCVGGNSLFLRCS